MFISVFSSCTHCLQVFSLPTSLLPSLNSDAPRSITCVKSRQNTIGKHMGRLYSSNKPKCQSKNTTNRDSHADLMPFCCFPYFVLICVLIIGTIFSHIITELTYNGKGGEVYFWVGVGPQPHSKGTKIPDEHG